MKPVMSERGNTISVETSSESPSNSEVRSSGELTVAFPVLAAILLTIICLKFLPIPFVWVLWAWTLVFLNGFLFLKMGFVRVAMFNAAIIVAVLAIAESYCAFRPDLRPTYSEPYMVSDDILGTVPIKGTHARSTEFGYGLPIYDVTYTIDANGLRVAPPSTVSESHGSILFFGCSFTFGEGVKDDQTLPYQVGIQSQGQYKVYNFAFHGYGPHQMLAAIESGRVRDIVAEPPRYAIYQVIPDHVARVAGKIPYGQHSPRYVLNADDTVRLAGHFDDAEKPASRLEAKLVGQLHKSMLFRTLESLKPRTNEEDVHLLLAIVRKSRDLLVAEYPGIEFHIILRQNFDYEQARYQELQKEFSQMNIPVHLLENILPDYNADPQRYWLNPHDRHPNSLQNRLIAEYVVTKILSRNESLRDGRFR